MPGMRPTALTLLLLLLAGCAGDTKPAPRMAEEAIGAVRLGALEKLDHIAPASRLLDVCEADIVRYGYDAAAGECAAYLAGLFESAAIENLVPRDERRSEEHTSELQSLLRISYAVFCLKQKKTKETAKISTEKTTH